MRRILVVPKSLLEDLAAVLVGCEMFDLRATSTIDEALAMTAAWPPELIILGDRLRDGTPAELCARVRGDRRLESTRLLLVSSFLPGDEVGAEVLSAQLDAHLIQPVARESFLRTVGVLLDIQLGPRPSLPQELLARVELQPRGNTADPKLPVRSMLANVIALSDTGLKLECQDRLEPGDVLGVEFSLPGSDPNTDPNTARATRSRIELRCMVLNADALQLHYGCEFLDCGPQQKDAIGDYLRQELGATEA